MAKKKATTKTSSSAGSSPMDVDLLEQIVKLMSANDLNTVDLRDGGKRVILRRGAAVGPVQYTMGHSPMMAPARRSRYSRQRELARLRA